MDILLLYGPGPFLALIALTALILGIVVTYYYVTGWIRGFLFDRKARKNGTPTRADYAEVYQRLYR